MRASGENHLMPLLHIRLRTLSHSTRRADALSQQVGEGES